jgi:hypothetical protein
VGAFEREDLVAAVRIAMLRQLMRGGPVGDEVALAQAAAGDSERYDAGRGEQEDEGADDNHGILAGGAERSGHAQRPE